MATAPLFDVAALLAPLPGDRPAGRKLLTDERIVREFQTDIDPDKERAGLSAINDERTRVNEEARIRGLKRKPAEWDKVVDFSVGFLAKTGKDLKVVLFLVEAATRVAGFAGARDGFRLGRSLCETCWDYLHPLIEDAQEIEDRFDQFGSLNEINTTPFYPTLLRSLTVLDGPDDVPISFANCQPGAEKEPPLLDQTAIRNRLARATEADRVLLAGHRDDIASAVQELGQLAAVLDARAVEASKGMDVIEAKRFRQTVPGFGEVRKALVDCRDMVDALLGMAADANPMQEEAIPTATVATASPPQAGTRTATPRSGGTLATREEAYAKLAELLGTLEKLDPHSPVPFLIRRAIEMRGMKFPELVDAMAKGGVMEFVRTPLGGP